MRALGAAHAKAANAATHNNTAVAAKPDPYRLDDTEMERSFTEATNG